MSDSSKYPHMAGWKGNKLTGIHAAVDLGLPVHIVRPHASELERKGNLFPMGRAMGGLGHNVTVYSVERPTDG